MLIGFFAYLFFKLFCVEGISLLLVFLLWCLGLFVCMCVGELRGVSFLLFLGVFGCSYFVVGRLGHCALVLFLISAFLICVMYWLWYVLMYLYLLCL